MVKPHYKMPLGAVSSIMNRATGAALSVGGHYEHKCLQVQC